MKSDKQGFTLIEILVVIAVLGLLTSIALVGFNAVRQKSRNAKRMSDAGQYATALKMIFNETGSYPAPPRISASYDLYCLGDFPNNTCWRDQEAYKPAISFVENAELNASVARYFPALPINSLPWAGGTTLKLYAYRCIDYSSDNTKCDKAEIFYGLEGNTAPCPAGEANYTGAFNMNNLTRCKKTLD